MVLDINRIIKKYLHYSEVDLQRSANSMRSIKKDLEQFAEYLVDNTAVDISENGITTIMVRGYLVTLQEKELAKTTINRKLSTLKSLFRYAYTKKYIDNDPAAQLKGSIHTKESITVVTDDEVQEIVKQVNLKRVTGMRDRLIIEMMYSTGMRSSEILMLNEKMIDIEKQEIYVPSKDEMRVVKFNARSKEYLKEYIEAKREKYGDVYSSEILFTNSTQKRLTDRSLRRSIERYVKNSNIKDKKVTPHTFRHSFAVKKLRGGATLRDLKKLLGHKSIESTRIYGDML